MSEFGGLWKHENNPHELVPVKMECGCPSGGGFKIIKNPVTYATPLMEKSIKTKWLNCTGSPQGLWLV